MVKSVEERAAEAKFTANDKKVFDFIMCKKRVACFLTTNEIAEYVAPGGGQGESPPLPPPGGQGRCLDCGTQF